MKSGDLAVGFCQRNDNIQGTQNLLAFWMKMAAAGSTAGLAVNRTQNSQHPGTGGQVSIAVGLAAMWRTVNHRRMTQVIGAAVVAVVLLIALTPARTTSTPTSAPKRDRIPDGTNVCEPPPSSDGRGYDADVWLPEPVCAVAIEGMRFAW